MFWVSPMCRHSQSVGAPKIKNFSQETFPDEAAEVVGKEALLHISWRFLSKMPSWSTLDSKNSPTMTYKLKFLGNFRIIICSLLGSLIPKSHRYCAYKSLHAYYICTLIHTHIYIFIYVYIYIYVYISIYLSISIYTYLYLSISIYLSIYLPIYLSIYII
jgi:hypothetical protein